MRFLRCVLLPVIPRHVWATLARSFTSFSFSFPEPKITRWVTGVTVIISVPFSRSPSQRSAQTSHCTVWPVRSHWIMTRVRWSWILVASPSLVLNEAEKKARSGVKSYAFRLWEEMALEDRKAKQRHSRSKLQLWISVKSEAGPRAQLKMKSRVPCSCS